MPHIDDDSQNQILLMQDFIFKRYLMYKFTPDLHSNEPSFDSVANLDYGIVSAWKEGDALNPIPSGKSYNLCYLKTSSPTLNQMYFMHDENFFILIKPNI
jgi:hypothetical protein